MKYYVIEALHSKAVRVDHFEDKDKAIMHFKVLAEENGADMLVLDDYIQFSDRYINGFWEDNNGYGVTLTMAE